MVHPPRLCFKVKCKMEDDGTPPRLCFKVKCKNGMMVPGQGVLDYNLTRVE